MDKLQEMKEYMKPNQLKKVMFGGYNKEDVHMKFEMLAAMLDDYVKEQAEKEKVMLADFENKLQEMQQEFDNKKQVTDFLIIDLNKSISEITSQNKNMEVEHSALRRTIDALTAENEQMVQDQFKIKEAYKTYCSEIIKRYSESLDTLSEEFNKMLDNVSMVKKSISEESIVEGLGKAIEMLGSKID
ncbi:MAG: hypothetical protein U0L05_05350 [Schaedlerella sp.]|nr:hypothetical protein [Schaedlerella sp.]